MLHQAITAKLAPVVGDASFQVSSPPLVSLSGVFAFSPIFRSRISEACLARGPGWDPDQEAQLVDSVDAVCGRFFQRVKCLSGGCLHCPPRLLSPQPHHRLSVSCLFPLTDYEVSLFFPSSSQPDPVPAPPGLYG